jgi:hypothetical protein
VSLGPPFGGVQGDFSSWHRVNDQGSVLVEDEGDEFDEASRMISSHAQEAWWLVVSEANLTGLPGRPGVLNVVGFESVFER